MENIHSKVIKILSIQRPTDLKRSSSIGEGIYGRDLDFLWDKEQEIIPVVELLLESLLTKELGSIPLPLQRCSASIVFELKRQLDSGFVLNFSQIPGVNVYTLLYDFFAEMSTPLIPPDLAYQFLYAAGIQILLFFTSFLQFFFFLKQQTVKLKFLKQL